MLTRVSNDRGMTIIETMVMLSVMFILAGVLSPIVSESITTAREVKAKSDAIMLATALINLTKDLGADALSSSATTSGSYEVNSAISPASFLASQGRSGRAARLPEVLISEGTDPSTTDSENTGSALKAPMVSMVSLSAMGQKAADASSSRTPRSKWLQAGRDLLNDYLVTNTHGFRMRRPGENDGWNGPYLSAKLPGDPWGNRYMINSSWLDGGATASDAAGNLRSAVYVVSAGANGIIETPFNQPITDAKAYGDDIVVRIQ